MLDVEIMRAFAAAELLFKNIDVSKMNRDDIKKALQEQKDLFVISVDKKLKEFIDLYNDIVLRKGTNFDSVSEKELEKIKRSVNMHLTYDNFLDIIRLLKAIGVDSYLSLDEELFDPNFEETMKAIEAAHDYTKAFNCPLKELNPLNELKIMLALCQYPKDLGQKIYDYACEEHEFKLKGFEDFEVNNNRIIIPLSAVDKYNIKKRLKQAGYTEGFDEVLSINALVISKNPIDYFYSSYGNAFQSCFSLNSSMSCWYGYVPFVMAEESFIVYATTGEVMKTGIIGGSKFHNPNMLWRAWGYADKKGSLLIDKKYRKADNKYNVLIEECCDIMQKRFNIICDGPHYSDKERKLLNKGEGLYNIWEEYGLKFYADSIRKSGKGVIFKYGRGSNTDAKYTPKWIRDFSFFIEFSKTVLSVGDIDLTKTAVIENGLLMCPKACPITSMPIPQARDKHVLSKYFTKAVKSLAVITYIDGTVFTDYLTEGYSVDTDKIYISKERTNARIFSEGRLYTAPYLSAGRPNRAIPLKTLKEILKSEVSKTDIDAILLRVVEDDKVTCQVFRGK